MLNVSDAFASRSSSPPLHEPQFLFKKYLAFERDTGADGGEERVRELARSYVQSLTSATNDS